MGAGFALMNDVTVLQASQGLAQYVLSVHKGGEPVVVVGHDHRLNSKRFAEITATAFILKGFDVKFLSDSDIDKGLVPTPLVPFAVDLYKATCGVMITASHNPALDNGYKVYWNNGCQIIPPVDQEIANEILNNLKPAERAYELEYVMQQAYQDTHLSYVKEDVIQKYIDHIRSTLVFKKVDIPFVYTPMHGVGLEVFSKASSLLGISNLRSVREQSVPDPLFPSVKFPNPEEKGALDLAIRTATQENVALVLANDPDADRFSCAVKDSRGNWRQLTGNELGYLFASYMLQTVDKTKWDKVYLLNSTVSSQMIRSMSETLGCHYTDTLTGFKWIGNKAIELERDGSIVPFGFEEAIGFMFPGIHDKDGICAAIVFLQMAQQWYEEGTNALDVLEDGFKRFGYFKEYNSYYTVHDPSYTKTIFDKFIRSSYDEYPERIGRFNVGYWRDLTIGYQLGTAGNKPDLPVDPTSQMITGRLYLPEEKDVVVSFTMRGSGTEPKLKVYVEAQASTGEKATNLSIEVWKTLRSQWFKPEVTGLKEA